jgi:hypothetical protein
MGLVTLDLPIIGQPNTGEDVKVRNNFQTLQNTINGNIDTPNLTPALLASLGSNKQVYSAKQVLEVGQVGQIRAGRVLTPADFTNMGLSAPLGLWNLGTVNDASGNARNLINKGAVTFDTGITGAASEAAVFTGSTAQALYIVDTGATDPFRIKTGSWSCWLSCSKRGLTQDVMARWSGAGLSSYLFELASSNVMGAWVSLDGTNGINTTGITDIVDSRWHHIVATFDGTRIRLYVDGALEASSTASGTIHANAAPLNIGGRAADAGTATSSPFFGCIDEAFITTDVLSDDQVRNLYCTSIAHTLGSIPSGSRLAVRRRRRGTTFAVSDFPATPVRLHNFTAGALTDEGSGAVGLTSNPGTGAIVAVAGSGGLAGNGYSFSGAHNGLSATDAGLPSGLTSRSYGTWFKGTGTGQGIIGWGTLSTADARLTLGGTGLLAANSGADAATGPVANDGLWHFAVVVEDNVAVDLVKRKLYLDGRTVVGSTVLNTLTLAGANRFRIGANPDGTAPFIGQVGGAFVYAGALTPSQIQTLYNVAGQQLALSPKSDADHIEAFETSRLLAAFDSIEGTDLVDLTVIS